MIKYHYQMCTRCVMDTTDPEIQFDDKGICNHCHYFDQEVRPSWFPNDEGKKKLDVIVSQIKKEGKGKRYDCIIGLSGGTDSSFVALKIHEHDLRPLVVHVDGGWNSELAVNNIERLIKHCGWDLFTIVIDWSEMRDLQVAYFRSGVANQDVPQDHAFFAALYNYATKNNVRYVIHGGNNATEAIFPYTWEHPAVDAKNLKAIHKRFGKIKLKSYPLMSFWKYYFYYPFIRRMKVIRPLNYMPYNKKEAIKELEKIGWRTYERKHGESIFTKFFQNYYLPERFGYDKRKPHLSTMVLAGQITREEALSELEKPLYDSVELKEDKLYVQKKLGLSEKEFNTLLKLPAREAAEFPSNLWIYDKMKLIQTIIQKKVGRSVAKYS